ncbi:MAG: family 78 glycoside hydrolase catalytic domain [Phycisphaerales bacterium]|nr:family 78 glycoside hydrolase catalytic domain [Phycisphaerales bacterium]
MIKSVFLLASIGMSWVGAAGQVASPPSHLRCEYLTNPLGIDTPQPRLSWELQDSRRGARQTAYEIQVAADAAALESGGRVIWQSEKVASASTMHIEYAGPALESGRAYWWRVRTWDAAGAETGWSRPAMWSTGLLKPEDWKASWIGVPGERTPAVSGNNGYHSEVAERPDDTRWIAIDLGKTQNFDLIRLCPARPHDWKQDAPGFLFPLRYVIETSPDGANWSALIADRSGADQPNPGAAPVEIAVENASSRFVRLRTVRLAARTPPNQDGYGIALAEFQVLSEGKNIAEGRAATASDSIEHNDWSVKALTDGVTESRGPRPAVRGPSPTLRKTFSIAGPVKRATLYATALGLYEARLNGERVGDAVLAPEWTDYAKRVQVQTYDVTPLIHPGENAIAAILADGWFAGKVGLFSREIYGTQLALRAQLEVELADGSRTTIATDGSWAGTSEGPWRATDILDGVTYDARHDLKGFDRPGDCPGAWSPVQVLNDPRVELVAQMNEPIRIVSERRAESIAEPMPGVFVVDLGQNLTGWVKLKTRGPAGTTITLRYAEALNPDGTVYTTNLRGAKQTDTFILAGGRAAEVFTPAFTYHGFRYVQITGLAERPTQDSVVGQVVYSDLPVAGRFECSDPMLNKLMSNIIWTQMMNMQSTPTDCPQRDERLGWMGDAQVFAQAACFNRGMAPFFTKWLRDVRDAQHQDGRFPDFAPNPAARSGKFVGVPAWGDAGTIVPWRIFQNYADTTLLARHFDAARAWVEYIHRQNPDLVWRTGRGNDYNDWLNADTLKIENWPAKGGEIPREVFATAFFFHSTDLVARMARALGRDSEAATYSDLAAQIREVFRRDFITPDGRMPGDTQAGYALALEFNLCPDELRGRMIEHLVEGIARYSGHPSTGFISTMPMMRQLAEAGHADLAYKLLLNRTIPSWGYMIDQGATTIWERWDGYVAGRGFQDPGMNSLAHYSIGAVGEWMYRFILGINPDDDHPGYKRFTIRPTPGGGLSWARGSYASMHGPITVDWKHSAGRFTLLASVPPNTTATIIIPAKNAASVSESGVPVERSPGLKIKPARSGFAAFEVGAGSYMFDSTP